MQAAENDEKRNQGQAQPTVDPGSGYQHIHGTVRKPSILDGPVETKSEDQQSLQQDATTPENSFVLLGKDGDSIMGEDGIYYTQYRKHFEASDQEHQEHKEAAAANFQQEEKSGMDPQKLSPCRERIQNNETESRLEQNPEERGRAVHQNPAVPGDPDIRSSPKGQNTQTPDTKEYETRGSPGMVTTGRRPTDGLATGSPTDAKQKSPSGRTTDSPATNLTDQVGLPRMVSPRVDSGHSKDQTGIPETEYDLTPYPNYTGSRIPQYDVEYGPNRNPDYVGGKTSTPDKYQPLQYPAGNNQTPRYQGQTIPRNIGYPASMNQQYPQQMYMNPLVNQTGSYSLDSNRGSQDESLPDIYRSGLPGKQQRDPEMSDNMNSSDTPKVNATIKVSGYPESFDLNVLGMYVESEKRFGARVNSIVQRRHCILVNVPSIEDAERVCSKEHYLLDCNLQLEIYSPESEQVATRLKVTGYPPTFHMDILEMYLENERGIGAKTENIAIDKADGCTYFTVSSLEDAERICEQKHEVYGCQLKVEIYRPEEEKKAQEILKLVVSGYPESFDLSILEMYLENEKRLGAKAEKVEVGKGQSFVTLSCLDDIELVCKKQHKLADCVLNIEVYQPQLTIDKTARTVKVSGYSTAFNEEVLQLFFESEKKFGAKCEELKIDAAKGCSFVTLSSVQDVEKVLSEERRLGNMPLTIKKMQKDISKENFVKHTSSDCQTVKISGDLELDKIRKYINNTKKFGVKPVCIENRDGCLIVTLSTSEDVVYILKKKHVVRGCNLTLELLDNPSSEESDEDDEDDDEESGSDDSDDSEKGDRNIIRISGSKNVHKIKKYVTNVDKFGVNFKQLEIVNDNVLVTLHDQKDVDTVLERKHTLKGCELKVEVLGNSDQSSDSSNSISDEDTSAKTCVVKVSGSNKMKILKEYVNNEEAFGAKIIDMKVDKTSKCIYATLATSQEAVKVCAKERGKIRVKLTEHQTSDLKNDISESDKYDANPKNSKNKSNDAEKENGGECKHCLRIDGADVITMETKVRYYIENRKKFGASAENIEFDEDDNCAYVTVSSKKDALEVCKRNHVVNNKDLNVEICTPPPDDTRRFLITNLSDEASKDTLINYIESTLDVDVLQILYSLDATRALIEYDQSDTTYEKVKSVIANLKESDITLRGQVVGFKFIKTSRRIKADLSKTDYDEEDIVNYAEKSAEVQSCDMMEDRKVLITFKEFDGVERFCSKEHTFQFDVYYKCLGEAGGIENPHVFIKPENATMEMSESDRYKLEFIHQTDSNLDDFKCHMSKSHTVVEWDRDGLVHLVCTLTKDVKDARKLAKTWKDSSMNHLRSYLDDLHARTYKNDEKILDEVYKNIQVTQPNVVNIMKGKTPMTMVVVGRDGNIFEDTIRSIDEVIRQTEAEIERKRQEITKTVSTKYSYSLLEKFGLIDDTKAKWPHLEISSSGQESKDVYVKGLVGDISEAEDFLNERASQIKVKTLSFADDDSVTLLTNQEVVDYIISEHLNNQNNMAIWTRNHGDQPDVEVIAKDEQCLTKIYDLLKGVMTKKSIDYDPESKEIFKSTEWKDLVDKIQKDYPNLFLINLETEGKVLVTAVTELIDVVVPGIEDFICTKKIYTETISFNRGQNYILENVMKRDTEQLIRKLGKSVQINRSFRTISVKGRKQDVNKARSELAGHLERITETEMKFTDEHELRYFQSEEGFNATSRVTNGYIERSDRGLDECGRFIYGEKYIDVIAGDITQLDVDIIVCPTDTYLSNSGGLAHSIVQKDNGRIVEECQKMISNRGGCLQTGECVVTTAGNLPCKNVIHVVLPGGSDPQTRSRDFTTVFMKVLEKVMENRLTSVAFPVLGSGAGNFSLQESVETIFKALREHFSRCAFTTIKQIYIVDMNEVNVAAVIDHLRGNPLFSEEQYSPPIMRRSPARKEKVVKEVKVRITKGEIAKAGTDVIVNSTSTTLNLSSGAISGSILMAAGMKLQSECKKAYPKGINCGDVAITRAYGKLQCKMVLHACLKTYDDAKEEGLRDMILTCLHETEKRGLQSISFPAIGCGVLKYPPQTVAETFLKTVNEYVTKGGAIKAENIHIVLYPKDTEIIKTFEAVMSNPNSRTKTDSGKQNIEGKITENDLIKGVEINDKNIKIVKGDILERGVTAIVHGTNAQLDFSKGQVSKCIQKKEGRNLISQCKEKLSDMKAFGIITTKTINMNCKTIIHVDQLRFSSDVKSGLASCMQVAEYNMFRSVAFPILFTGYGASHEEFAEAMFKNIVETNFQFLETIEIVIFHLDDYKRVVETLLRLIEEYQATNEKQASGGFFSPIKKLWANLTAKSSTKVDEQDHSSSVDTSSFLSESGTSSGENRSANTRSFHSTVGDREITFRIYSLGRNDEIEDYINQCYENATKHLEVPLTVDVDEQQIMAIMERIPVKIRFIPNLRKVVIFGLKEDVLHAQSAVHEINHFEVEKKGKEESHRIEQKQRKAAEINKAGIPINWTSHVQTGYEAVELDEDSEEYKKVANNFNSSLGVPNCTIVKIERIENPILYKQYLAKKEQLLSDLGNLKIKVEREVLWHGCAEGSVESINKNGFNRNFCGKNATHFGNGVYFAVNSRYSAQYRYATPDSAGTRRMYQCRVLVGDTVEFDDEEHNKDMPPPNPNNGNRQHDSFVDDINDPVMFVIFHDSGAYPDYIISYNVKLE